MDIEIISDTLKINIYGFSAIAVNNDYAGTAFKLMDMMWQIVKANNLKNKGQNIWVYEPGGNVFAGVELYDTPPLNAGLQQKSISLTKYAYHKHIGPYNMIKHAGQKMTDEIKSRGYKITSPYIEIYGHWTNDETKLETELLKALV